MELLQSYDYLTLFVAAFVAGAVNAVAGGGTLLTFPALLWAHQTEIVANATSTVALWPGQLSSLWGYRKEIASSPRAIGVLAVPSLVGGLVGSLLLVKTDNAIFAAIVPYLILGATLLFMVQEPLARWQRRRAEESKADGESPGSTNGGPAAEKVTATFCAEHPKGRAGKRWLSPFPRPAEGNLIVDSGHYPLHRWLAVMGFQSLVAVYGGYFGAGIGILMLAAFGFLGLRNIHHMNGLKNINGMAINGVAAILFIVKGLVDWRLASLMAAGAIAGGYAGAGTAQRIGQKNVRRIVILIGFGLTISLLLRR